MFEFVWTARASTIVVEFSAAVNTMIQTEHTTNAAVDNTDAWSNRGYLATLSHKPLSTKHSFLSCTFTQGAVLF